MAVRFTLDHRSLHGHPEDGVTVAPGEGGNPAIRQTL